MRSFIAKYFSFTGRMRRKEYLFVIIALNIFVYLLILWENNSNRLNGLGIFNNEYISPILFFLLIIILALHFTLWGSSTIRRLHDLNLSGWWFLLFIVTFAMGGILDIILVLIPGTKGPNKYGPDPLEKSEGVEPSSNAVSG